MFHDGTVFRSGSELTVFALERAISIGITIFPTGRRCTSGLLIGLLLHSIRVVVSSFRVVKVP